ncbi:MAG: ABC transporter ATP-binding protein [Sulfolobales archaeon]|nr:ABC transporter ATP-binding protein [Sulfolobales archaeon]MCX8198690.1 ABC transporter ATP-binding protein [Sulfolobales archaeon]MDW8169763.1 ABC transporter ATP-binding protein [Desulfurococcaceae archaeon]
MTYLRRGELFIEGFSSKGIDVEARDLVKIYKIGRTIEVHALRGVNINIKAGEAVCIMGPSGSGKTTLLNIIGGVDKPTGGQVVVGGVRVHELDEDKLERYRLKTVGYIFQAFNLVPMLTALENVELPMIPLGIHGHSRRRRAEWLLKAVGLGDKLYHKPFELSGGEQQRVAIAVALANDPPLILADEPTAELDIENAMRVIDLLIKLSKESGKTVIVSTHDPRIAIRADRILRMEDGVIKSEHKPVELEEGASLTKLSSLADEVKARLAVAEKQLHELAVKLSRGEISGEHFDKEYLRLKILIEGYKEILASLGH